MLPLARGMLDRQDDDFLSRIVNCVIDEVTIFSDDELTHTFNSLRSTDLWKQDQILERMKNSGANLPGGNGTVQANVVCDGG